MMTLQMSPKDPDSQFNVKYAPTRDITYLYPNVISMAEAMIYEQRYAPLHSWLRDEGVTETDLAETVRLYCLVLNDAHKRPEETLQNVMDRVGFSAQPEAAKAALMYYIGMLMAGTFFQGLRDVTPLGADESLPEVVRLLKTGDEFAEYAAAPWWKRWYIRYKRKWFPNYYRYRFGIGGVKP